MARKLLHLLMLVEKMRRWAEKTRRMSRESMTEMETETQALYMSSHDLLAIIFTNSVQQTALITGDEVIGKVIPNLTGESNK